MENSQEIMKQVVNNIYTKGWNRQEFDDFSGYLPGPVDFWFRGAKNQTNLEELKALILFWRTAFPDLYYEIVDLIAENNLVGVNLVVTGTHLGEWWGIAPTGRKIRFEEMMFYRFENNRIVEIWEVYDEYELRRQLTTA